MFLCVVFRLSNVGNKSLELSVQQHFVRVLCPKDTHMHTEGTIEKIYEKIRKTNEKNCLFPSETLLIYILCVCVENW